MLTGARFWPGRKLAVRGPGRPNPLPPCIRGRAPLALPLGEAPERCIATPLEGVWRAPQVLSGTGNEQSPLHIELDDWSCTRKFPRAG